MLKTWEEDNIAVVQLDKGRSNAMDAEMVNKITAQFNELAADDSIAGVVLTGKERFFSAGLDVIALYGYDKPTIRQFWVDFSQMVKTLVTFPKPLVASITGHSPAGGCVLALCCDYRVMAEGKYRIGLNEVPVGIPIPQYIFALYSYWVGKGAAHRFLLEGKLHTTKEAIACNLVDDFCPEEEVLGRAKAKMKQYLSLNRQAWLMSKKVLRADLHHVFNQDLAADMDVRMEQWWRPSTRATLGAIVTGLKKGK